LIICRKDDDELLIVSDTKLTYPSDQFPGKQTGHPSDGVIKTVIVNPNLCVSFAGDIEPAEEGIKLIQPGDDLTRVLKLLRDKSSSNRTDFIVCVSNPDIKIFEIKDSICKEVQSSWIGSSNAFTRFQGYFYNQIQVKKDAPSSFIKIEPVIAKKDSDLSKVSGAFDKIIDDPSVPEVDGFKVMVIVENGVFKYRGYLHNYMGLIELKIDPKMLGKEIPLGHGNADDGSYMVNFFNSNSNYNNVAIHILQGGLGIVYSRIDNGLLRPKIFQLDEVDFVDFTKETYDLGPGMITQNREQKYFKNGDLYLKSNDYKAAIFWFDKVLTVEEGKMKARAHYAKGICLLNLRRPQEGVIEIQKAINIDANLHKEAMKLLSKLKKW
jgi:hypothetical protein